MDILILNGYTTPAPTSYDVEYSDVNGEESGLEDGTTYLEQVRADVPEIKASWTNLTKSEATNITSVLANDIITVKYFYGELKTAKMRKGSRSLKLKSIDNQGETYWNLSITLKG